VITSADQGLECMSVHYIILARNAGFFSNFNGVLNRLRFMSPEDACTVEWDVRKLRTSDESESRQGVPYAQQTSFPYGTAEDGNIWNRLFHPIDKPLLPGREYERRYIWNAHAPSGAYFDGHRRWAGASLPMYQSDFAWRQTYHDLFSRYIRVREHIRARVAAFESRIRERPTIAVHLRDPRHFVEQPGRERFSADNFVAAMEAYPEHQFFVATDQEHMLDSALRRFGDRIIYQEQCLRRPLELRERQLVHRVPGEPTGDLQFAEDVVSDVLLMAQCEALVHVISNLAAAAGYINPALRFHYVGPGARTWTPAVLRLVRANPPD